MVLSFLFFAFIAYLVYRVVVNFILPIYRTTQQMKKTFRGMRENMPDAQSTNPANGSTFQQPKQPASTKASRSDYIDFEEIKN